MTKNYFKPDKGDLATSQLIAVAFVKMPAEVQESILDRLLKELRPGDLRRDLLLGCADMHLSLDPAFVEEQAAVVAMRNARSASISNGRSRHQAGKAAAEAAKTPVPTAAIQTGATHVSSEVIPSVEKERTEPMSPNNDGSTATPVPLPDSNATADDTKKSSDIVQKSALPSQVDESDNSAASTLPPMPDVESKVGSTSAYSLTVGPRLSPTPVVPTAPEKVARDERGAQQRSDGPVVAGTQTVGSSSTARASGETAAPVPQVSPPFQHGDRSNSVPSTRISTPASSGTASARADVIANSESTARPASAATRGEQP